MSSYVEVATPAGGPVLPSLRSHLQGAGFVLVTQDYSADVHSGITGNEIVDVYRAPAASNVLGIEWYLALATGVDATNRYLLVTVFEGWDDATKQATRYIPLSNNVAPVADFSVGPAAALSAAHWLIVAPSVPLADGMLVSLRLDDTNSVIVANNYAGLLDRHLPVSLDPVPLVTCRLENGLASPSVSYGGCTREPGQTVAAGFNFRVQAHSTLGSNRLITGITTELYSGRQLGSPVKCLSSRGIAISLRGTYRGVRAGSSSAAVGDTMTEALPDGSTRIYVCSYGIGSIFTARF